MKSDFKFLIVNSLGKSGGNIALSILCKLLIERGYDAKIYNVHAFPDEKTDMKRFRRMCWKVAVNRFCMSIGLKRVFRKALDWNFRYTGPDTDYTPVRGVPEKIFPVFDRDKTIVIYPEVVYGNFLDAKHVVRWLLYKNRYKDVDGAFGKDDVVMCYREYFNDWDLNPEGYEVRLAYFDNEMYRQYNFGERNERCYLIRKGRERSDLPSSFDGPVIDYGMYEKDIVEILNNHKYCYIYDTQTFYAKIAAVCGCIPIIVPEPGKTRADYVGKSEPKLLGIAYGDSAEAVDFAVSTRDELMKTLDYTDMNKRSIDIFEQMIEDKFASHRFLVDKDKNCVENFGRIGD